MGLSRTLSLSGDTMSPYLLGNFPKVTIADEGAQPGRAAHLGCYCARNTLLFFGSLRRLAQDTVAFGSAFAPSASNAPVCAGSAMVSASGVMNVTVWLGSVEVMMGLHSHVVITPVGRCEMGAGCEGGVVEVAVGGQGFAAGVAPVMSDGDFGKSQSCLFCTQASALSFFSAQLSLRGWASAPLLHGAVGSVAG
jgi:hypothetical protein